MVVTTFLMLLVLAFLFVFCLLHKRNFLNLFVQILYTRYLNKILPKKKEVVYYFTFALVFLYLIFFIFEMIQIEQKIETR